MQFWDTAKRKCKSEGRDDLRIKNQLFKIMCRDHFDTLEPFSRVRKQITIPLKIFEKRRHLELDSQDPASEGTSKRPRQSDTDDDLIECPAIDISFSQAETLVLSESSSTKNTQDVSRHGAADPSPKLTPKTKKRGRATTAPTAETVQNLCCEIGLPPVRGRKSKPCRICGYVIKPTQKQIKSGVSECVKFDCCNKEAHAECWKTSRRTILSEPLCKEVKTWLQKDRKSPRLVTLKDKEARQGDLVQVVPCEFCGMYVKILPERKNHVLEDCPAAKAGRSLESDNQSTAKKPRAMSFVDRYYDLLMAQVSKSRSSRRTLLRTGVSSPAAPIGTDRGANAADSEVT